MTVQSWSDHTVSTEAGAIQFVVELDGHHQPAEATPRTTGNDPRHRVPMRTNIGRPVDIFCVRCTLTFVNDVHGWSA